jgi:hypothetical protein
MKCFIIFVSIIGCCLAGSGEDELISDLDSCINDIQVTRLTDVNDISNQFATRARKYSSEYQQVRFRVGGQYEAFIVNEALGIEMELDQVSFDYSLRSQFSEAAVRAYINAQFVRTQLTYINAVQNDIRVWQRSSRLDRRALQCWRTESRKFVKQMIITVRQKIKESVDRNVALLDSRITTFRSTVNQRVEFWEKGASQKCGKKGSSKEAGPGTSGEKRGKRRRCKVVYVS